MGSTTMGIGNERGFTIIETILFLAVSGLLLAIAMAGVSTNINTTRFNDAIQSTTSYLQQQYDEVAAGKNDRANGLSCNASLEIKADSPQPPGMTNCVVLGRYIRLEGSVLTSRYIVGYTDDVGALPQDDNAALDEHHLAPIVAHDTVYASTYGVPWSINISGAKVASTPVSSLGLAIIRSPVTGNILVYSFNANGEVEPSLASGVLVASHLNQRTVVCFASDGLIGRNGNILVGAGQSQEVIQTDMSASAGDCS